LNDEFGGELIHGSTNQSGVSKETWLKKSEVRKCNGM